jgi:hypothetical protein
LLLKAGQDTCFSFASFFAQQIKLLVGKNYERGVLRELFTTIHQKKCIAMTISGSFFASVLLLIAAEKKEFYRNFSTYPAIGKVFIIF